jgi:hypothetical protein
LLLAHLVVALYPWITGCPAWLAGSLSLLALAGFAGTLGHVPGRHCQLQGLDWTDKVWRARVGRDAHEMAVRIGPGTRVFRGLVVLDLRAEDERLGWLLPRAALGPEEFRRLKVRLRLTC